MLHSQVAKIPLALNLNNSNTPHSMQSLDSINEMLYGHYQIASSNAFLILQKILNGHNISITLSVLSESHKPLFCLFLVYHHNFQMIYRIQILISLPSHHL